MSQLVVTRRRRRWIAPVTLLVLLGFVGGAAWYGWNAFVGNESTASCGPQRPAGAPVTPSDVTLNVYNATERSGLAGRTARSLRARGFSVDHVGNDPLGKTVAGAAEIRAAKGSRREVILVRRYARGAVWVRDNRDDGTVDLVLGNRFKHLSAVKKGAKVPVAVRRSPGC